MRATTGRRHKSAGGLSPVFPKEGGKVAAGHPYAVATSQQPQDRDFVQQLAQEAERHVEVHGEQAWSKRQRQVVREVFLPTSLAPRSQASPTYDHEEDTEGINGAGAFLGIRVHQEHHERPKDEEGDIAELEKRRTWGEGIRQGRQRRPGPMSKPSVISQLVTYLLSGNESTQSLSSLSAHLHSQWVISRSITPPIILWIHLFIQWVWQRLSTNSLPTFSPFFL